MCHHHQVQNHRKRCVVLVRCRLTRSPRGLEVLGDEQPEQPGHHHHVEAVSQNSVLLLGADLLREGCRRTRRSNSPGGEPLPCFCTSVIPPLVPPTFLFSTSTTIRSIKLSAEQHDSFRVTHTHTYPHLHIHTHTHITLQVI